MSKKIRGSDLPIWKFFDRSIDGNKTATCNYCHGTFSFRTTITNLKQHLKFKHKSAYKSLLNFHQTFVSNSGPGTVIEDDDSSQSSKGSKNENRVVIPRSRSSIKRETEGDALEEADIESEAVEDLWNFFEKISPNRARCILCKEIFNSHSITLTRHINSQHRKVALDLPSDSDDDQDDIYTEVVYLQDEEPTNSRKIRVKSPKKHQEPQHLPKKRRLSERKIYEVVQKVDSEPKREEKNDADEEIENFGRYLIGLLKKLPKDVCTQLQMDIISMVMTAKLKASMSSQPVNVSVSSIQDGVVFTPVSVSSANVIVTTPSQVNDGGENVGSLQSIQIMVDNEKDS